MFQVARVEILFFDDNDLCDILVKRMTIMPMDVQVALLSSEIASLRSAAICPNGVFIPPSYVELNPRSCPA